MFDPTPHPTGCSDSEQSPEAQGKCNLQANHVYLLKQGQLQAVQPAKATGACQSSGKHIATPVHVI